MNKGIKVRIYGVAQSYIDWKRVCYAEWDLDVDVVRPDIAALVDDMGDVTLRLHTSLYDCEDASYDRETGEFYIESSILTSFDEMVDSELFAGAHLKTLGIRGTRMDDKETFTCAEVYSIQPVYEDGTEPEWYMYAPYDVAIHCF